MKVKLKDLNPNPFKKTINKGKLSQTQINIIKSNIEELGLMGSLPVFKKNDKYYLIAGHHRTEALRQVYGKDYKVEVTVHDYFEDQILRGMVIENLTQRADDLMEVTENLASVREYLKSTTRSDAEHVVRPQGGGSNPESGSLSHIQKWLNKNGEIMSKGKISEYLKVYDNLDRRLLLKTIKVHGGNNNENIISIEEAKSLARVEKKDQIKMLKLLKNTGLDYKRNSKLITKYNQADDEIKRKILGGEEDITNVEILTIQTEALNGKKPEPIVRDLSEWIIDISDSLIRTSKLLDMGLLENCSKSELNNLKYHTMTIFDEYYKPFFIKLSQLEKEIKVKQTQRIDKK